MFCTQGSSIMEMQASSTNEEVLHHKKHEKEDSQQRPEFRSLFDTFTLLSNSVDFETKCCNSSGSGKIHDNVQCLMCDNATGNKDSAVDKRKLVSHTQASGQIAPDCATHNINSVAISDEMKSDTNCKGEVLKQKRSAKPGYTPLKYNAKAFHDVRLIQSPFVSVHDVVHQPQYAKWVTGHAGLINRPRMAKQPCRDELLPAKHNGYGKKARTGNTGLVYKSGSMCASNSALDTDGMASACDENSLKSKAKMPGAAVNNLVTDIEDKITTKMDNFNVISGRHTLTKSMLDKMALQRCTTKKLLASKRRALLQTKRLGLKKKLHSAGVSTSKHDKILQNDQLLFSPFITLEDVSLTNSLKPAKYLSKAREFSRRKLSFKNGRGPGSHNHRDIPEMDSDSLPQKETDNQDGEEIEQSSVGRESHAQDSTYTSDDGKVSFNQRDLISLHFVQSPLDDTLFEPPVKVSAPVLPKSKCLEPRKRKAIGSLSHANNQFTQKQSVQKPLIHKNLDFTLEKDLPSHQSQKTVLPNSETLSERPSDTNCKSTAVKSLEPIKMKLSSMGICSEKCDKRILHDQHLLFSPFISIDDISPNKASSAKYITAHEPEAEDMQLSNHNMFIAASHDSTTVKSFHQEAGSNSPLGTEFKKPLSLPPRRKRSSKKHICFLEDCCGKIPGDSNILKKKSKLVKRIKGHVHKAEREQFQPRPRPGKGVLSKLRKAGISANKCDSRVLSDKRLLFSPFISIDDISSNQNGAPNYLSGVKPSQTKRTIPKTNHSEMITKSSSMCKIGGKGEHECGDKTIQVCKQKSLSCSRQPPTMTENSLASINAVTGNQGMKDKLNKAGVVPEKCDRRVLGDKLLVDSPFISVEDLSANLDIPVKYFASSKEKDIPTKAASKQKTCDTVVEIICESIDPVLTIRNGIDIIADKDMNLIVQEKQRDEENAVHHQSTTSKHVKELPEKSCTDCPIHNVLSRDNSDSFVPGMKKSAPRYIEIQIVLERLQNVEQYLRKPRTIENAESTGENQLKTDKPLCKENAEDADCAGYDSDNQFDTSTTICTNNRSSSFAKQGLSTQREVENDTANVISKSLHPCDDEVYFEEEEESLARQSDNEVHMNVQDDELSNSSSQSLSSDVEIIDSPELTDKSSNLEMSGKFMSSNAHEIGSSKKLVENCDEDGAASSEVEELNDHNKSFVAEEASSNDDKDVHKKEYEKTCTANLDEVVQNDYLGNLENCGTKEENVDFKCDLTNVIDGAITGQQHQVHDIALDPVPLKPRQRGKPPKKLEDFLLTHMTFSSQLKCSRPPTSPRKESHLMAPTIKRKRGRPPKRKVSGPEEPRDFKMPITPRKRGRPVKMNIPGSPQFIEKASHSTIPSTPRKRGRPKQIKSLGVNPIIYKRKRGRPRKDSVIPNQKAKTGQKKRGRPCKNREEVKVKAPLLSDTDSEDSEEEIDFSHSVMNYTKGVSLIPLHSLTTEMINENSAIPLNENEDKGHMSHSGNKILHQSEKSSEVHNGNSSNTPSESNIQPSMQQNDNNEDNEGNTNEQELVNTMPYVETKDVFFGSESEGVDTSFLDVLEHNIFRSLSERSTDGDSPGEISIYNNESILDTSMINIPDEAVKEAIAMSLEPDYSSYSSFSESFGTSSFTVSPPTDREKMIYSPTPMDNTPSLCLPEVHNFHENEKRCVGMQRLSHESMTEDHGTHKNNDAIEINIGETDSHGLNMNGEDKPVETVKQILTNKNQNENNFNTCKNDAMTITIGRDNQETNTTSMLQENPGNNLRGKITLTHTPSPQQYITVKYPPNDVTEVPNMPSVKDQGEGTAKSSCLCEFCGASFKTEQERDEHLVIHAGHPQETNNNKVNSDKKQRPVNIVHPVQWNSQNPQIQLSGEESSTLNGSADLHVRLTNIIESCKREGPKMLLQSQNVWFSGDQVDESFTANQPSAFKCSNCGGEFADKEELEFHCNTCEGDSNMFVFCCDLCPQRFGSETALLEHKRDHTPQKLENVLGATSSHSERSVICPFCEKSFPRLIHLQDHMVTHLPSRTHRCEQCKKGYTSERKLKKHIVKYHQSTPVTCANCCLQFKSKRHLKKHFKRGECKVV